MVYRKTCFGKYYVANNTLEIIIPITSIKDKFLAKHSP